MTWGGFAVGLVAVGNWLHARKAPIGSMIVTISATMMLQEPNVRAWVFLFAFGTGLAGSGIGASDAHVRAKQEWEKKGQDRRETPRE